MAESKNKKSKKIKQTEEDMHFIPRNYARTIVQPLWSNIGASQMSIQYTNDQLKRMLLDPNKNYKELQKASNYFWATNSLYQNFLYYLATMMTFDNYPYPTFITNNKDTMQQRLLKSAEVIKKAQVKEIAPMMLLRTLINGETYWYDLSDDGQNNIFVEIPFEYCQLALIDDDNIWRYFIDLNTINEETINELPTEIKDAYEEYRDRTGKRKKTRIIEGIEMPINFYLVSKKGFSMFAHMQKNVHDYPYLASMFMDFNSYEDNKDYYNQFLKSDNIKLIHLKIPVDKDTGIPIMDRDTIAKYHESAKEHMPANHAPLTNPFEVQGISVDKGQQAGINIVKHNSDVVHESSGISKTLFDANTTNGLGYSIKADASKMYPFLYYFTNLINYKLKKFRFQVEFLKVNRYDQLEIHKQYAVDLTYGGLRSHFIATSGGELYDFIMASKLETLIDYDQYLPAKLNANQMSGKDDNESGRPEQDEEDKADGTVVGEGYE